MVEAAVWLLVCVFALVKGDRTERIAGGLFLVSWVASMVAQEEAGFTAQRYAETAIDIVVLLPLGFLAWRSERSWPVWATAIQAVETAVHIARIAGFRVGSFTFQTALNLMAYGTIIALGIGTWIAWREREALAMKL